MSKDTRNLILQLVLLVAVIVFYLYLTAQGFALDCSKEGAVTNCDLRRTVAGVLTVEKRTVTELVIVRLADECEGESCRFRIELYDSQGGMFPVREQYTSGGQVQQRLVNMINEFIYDPVRTEIKLHDQLNWLVFMLPLGLIMSFVIYRASLVKPGKQRKKSRAR